ncbi:hypothetical protein [Pseudonocardia abyssalis]|uniref:DNA primase n=1 Tax=Pseudonocardia abyssalis TaxID=2792008 RepID=A0ABS6UVE7_9PSEU|nr:hypothetical protein [Pseudonocardia abyssalis]MBW0116626.1 hypothetical protein [Pseudonocardia abyssalis]MBW0136157.1 hypothetical protein [Pseudonocardia abyssalis]
MGHTTMKRTIVTALAGAALLLSSAGACGPAPVQDDDDNPGVSNQQEGDDDAGDDDAGEGDDD